MNLREYTNENILVQDGAMGTMLQQRGLGAGKAPETLNITAAEAVRSVHISYLEAGAKMILTNTFGANAHKLRGYDIDDIIRRAVDIAKTAAAGFNAYTALDIGPIGALLSPMGTLAFDEAYTMFQQQVVAGAKAGADAICIETMTDLYEAKCAVLAAKENCDLTVFCTMSFETNMRTFAGVDIPSMALTLQGLGVDYIGLNCSVGPAEMLHMAAELMKWTHLPIVIKPNAGLPHLVNGQTLFTVDPDAFAEEMRRILDLGVCVIGGCCGTTPAFIQKLADLAKGRKPAARKPLAASAVCSASQTVVLDRVRMIGERINPTGKKRFKAALLEHDMEYIASQAVEQAAAGADILDVNVGVPNIDEARVMADAVRSIQRRVSTPLQIDSTKREAIEAGLRAYNGKPVVNSVNGEEASLREILPLVKKYGAAVVGLTLDETGIPRTAEARLAIAQRIVTAAAAHGIPKQDVLIDCLTLTSGAEQEIAYETLRAVKLVKETLGVKTVLGVSNVSFGLPARGKLNRTFLTLALAHGLDLPILNPNDDDMVDAVYCYHQLRNIDAGSLAYINRFGAADAKPATAIPAHDLFYCVANGLKDEIKPVVRRLLSEHRPLDVVRRFLIPALDDVGKKYERDEIFLPQLLSSAEAARAAFDMVKEQIPPSDASRVQTIVLATVKGDVHDIGKNIVKVVLENYGYAVIDLGKDVEIERVAEEAVRSQAGLVGLSALMTTTLDSMQKTIQAIKKAGENIPVMVGGAVLTEPHAKAMGADYYGKDAMAAVAIAREVFA